MHESEYLTDEELCREYGWMTKSEVIGSMDSCPMWVFVEKTDQDSADNIRTELDESNTQFVSVLLDDISSAEDWTTLKAEYRFDDCPRCLALPDWCRHVEDRRLLLDIRQVLLDKCEVNIVEHPVFCDPANYETGGRFQGGICVFRYGTPGAQPCFDPKHAVLQAMLAVRGLRLTDVVNGIAVLRRNRK